MGVQGLGIGLIDGVTGIVRKPVEGIVLRKKRNEKENPTSTSPAGALYGGAAGFAKGVVQGRLFVWYYFLGFTVCFFFFRRCGWSCREARCWRYGFSH